MEFGMFAEFPIRPGMTHADAFEESFRLVETAEQAGMDSVWLAEHHFRPEMSVLASPLLVASAIASRTSRIKVGLAVQMLPLANLLRAAEEAATLDHICKGRFEYGIGRSGMTNY
jgi:alkanesulfonate monooxygenase SsuD/methylene tetrahydromethanopterin reductase-like flavin-dependent oxidoreductase (luciferase family)